MTHADQNSATRPTGLCSVCQEGLWQKLLGQIRLVDLVAVAHDGPNTTVTLDLLPLAHLRRPSSAWLPAESYSIDWTLNGDLQPELANQTSFSMRQVRGWEWEALVALHSDEVRQWASDEGTDLVRFTIV